MKLIIDVETTGKNRGDDAVGDFLASPFYVYNRIVTQAYKYIDEDTIYVDKLPLEASEDEPWKILDYVTLVIGHNIGFDLHYLRKTFPAWRRFIESDKITIWDTQKAEYILSGQSHLFPSLDDCAVKYGGELKDDRIKKAFKEGVCASEIPFEILAPYNQSDVHNTEIIYLAQVEECKRRGILPLMALEMEAVLATNEMEWQGMAFHLGKAYAEGAIVRGKRDVIEKRVEQVFKEYLIKHPDINVYSGPQLSCVLFGGAYKIYEQKGTGEFFKTGAKKGQEKTKKTEAIVLTTGLNLPTEGVPKAASGEYYLTNDDVLQAIDHPVVKDILEIRALNKEFSTYFEGMVAAVWPHDLCIHANLNNTQTVTGRLSSSAPNIQNIPRGSTSEIKKCFVSRFGSGGYILEGDYSQLEVVVQAILADDKTMKEDIVSGLDFHTLRLSYKLGIPYEECLKRLVDGDPFIKRERTDIKTGFSFPRAYGASAGSISRNIGLDIKVVQGIIDKEESRYASVKQWHDDVYSIIQRSRTSSDRRTKLGYPSGTGKFKSVTGKEYTFKEYDTTDYQRSRGIYTSFKPTEAKNYPVQGFAYEIIACAIADLRPKIVGREDGKLINTVHDSILIDCKKEKLDFYAEMLYNSMVRARDRMESISSLTFGLELGVDISYGEDWFTRNHIA